MEASHLSPRISDSVLLTIDLQRDFLDGAEFEIPGTSAVIPRVIEVVQAFRMAARPVVHVIRLYEPGSSDVDLPRRAAVEAGLHLVAPDSPGSQLAEGLLERHEELRSSALLRGELQHVGDREWIMYKPRWGAFHRTRLDALLGDLAVSTVVVAGCNLPNCPRATLFEASARDYRTVLVEDAVSQTSVERLNDLAAIGVSLMSSLELIEALRRLQ